MQGTAHCDIKGENVLIAPDTTPRLCDFELSRDLSVTATTLAFGGTPGFVAPEIKTGACVKPDKPQDLYLRLLF